MLNKNWADVSSKRLLKLPCPGPLSLSPSCLHDVAFFLVPYLIPILQLKFSRAGRLWRDYPKNWR